MKTRTWRIAAVLLFCIALSLSWSRGTAWAKSMQAGTVCRSGVPEAGAAEHGLSEEAALESRGQGAAGKDEGPGGADGKDEEPGGTEPGEQHSLVKTERREPTCAEEGNIEYWACTVCEKIFLDETGTQEIADKEGTILPKLPDHTWGLGIVTKKASCEKTGILTYTCDVCGISKTEKLPAAGHRFQDKLTRATIKKKGKIVSRCKVCGKVRKQTIIPRIKKITLSKTSYTYNGKTRAPRVKVVDAKGKKVGAKYYSVKNAKAKNVGTHTVKISFRGRYKGSVTRKYKIKPKKVADIRLAAEKKGFTVQFQKQSKQCSGYQLQYAKSPKFSGAVQVTLRRGVTKKTVGGLENSTSYYVRMRAFKTVKEQGKTKTYYSVWSGIKEVKTKDVKLICIDAGHQQRGDSSLEPIGPGAATYKAKVASGTSGVATGKPEYQLTLEVALKLQEELTRRGYDVLMTRTTHDVNISNSARAAVANNARCDAFIRIHANGSSNANVSGAITICQTPANVYCGAYYSQSRRLSEQILSHFTAACGCRNGGIWETDTMSGINWCSVPVTILEMGYMSNPSEDRMMSDPAYQGRMVQGIANGIDAYFAP